MHPVTNDRSITARFAGILMVGTILSGSITIAAMAQDKTPAQAAATKQDAAKTTQPANGAVVLDTITISNGQAIRFNEGQSQVYSNPGSTAYISSETIERLHGTSPADILKGVAGVQTGDSRNGGALDVNIRGIQGQSRVAVTVDGSQQAIDTYRGYGGQQQRSYIDPDLIGDVTITKGPSLAVGGAGAIGGTVAMRTITVQDILKAGQTSGFRVKGEIASNSTTYPKEYYITPDAGSNTLFNPRSGSGSVAYATTSEKFDFLAAYAYRNQGNYYAGKRGHDKYRVYNPRDGKEERGVAQLFQPGSEVLNTSYESSSALLKATIRPTDEQTLELGYRYSDNKIGEIMPSNILRNATGKIPQWEPGTMKIHTLTARYNYKPDDNDLVNVKANAWMTRADSYMFNGLVKSTPWGDNGGEGNPTTPGGYQDAVRNNSKATRWGIDVSNQSIMPSAVGDFTFDYGLSYQNESIGPGNKIKISQNDLNNNRFIRSGERQEFSAVGSVKWDINDRFSVNAGGRYTYYKTEDHNRQATKVKGSTDVVFAEPMERSGNAFAPSFGAKYNLTENSFLYANYSEGVKMPSLFESTLGLFNTAILSADLRPERSHMWEIGASTLQNNLFTGGDSGGLKFAYFNNKINDFITRDYSTLSGYILNVDSFTVSGMELQASYDMGRVFADLSGTYYFNARTCAPQLARKMIDDGWGDVPDCVDGGFAGSYSNTQNPPKYSINMTVGTRWLDEKLVIGGRAIYNAGPIAKLEEEWHIGISTNQVLYRPTMTFDAFASYELRDDAKLNFSVENITNQFYLDPLAQSFMPAPGRTYKAALSVKF